MEIVKVNNLQEIDGIELDIAEYDEEIANPDLGDDRIIVTGPLYRLRDTKLIIATGTYCNYNEDTGELEPDFSISLLYKSASDPDFDRPLHWEQDPPATMIHNYLHILEAQEGEQETVASIIRAVA